MGRTGAGQGTASGLKIRFDSRTNPEKQARYPRRTHAFAHIRKNARTRKTSLKGSASHARITNQIPQSAPLFHRRWKSDSGCRAAFQMNVRSGLRLAPSRLL